MASGLIIAAPASGSGKTVITMALLRAFAKRGTAVSAFKVGPDYIDPEFHAVASLRPCRTIDLWAMKPSTVQSEVACAASGSDLVIGEGVMGLFDGSLAGTGSTADVAALLRLPVVLVVDVTGQGSSVAAMVEGFRDHRNDVDLAGVILNRVAGETHRTILMRALDEVATVFGHVNRHTVLELPHRYLGLVQATEHRDLDAFLNEVAALVADTVDLEGLAAAARPLSCSVASKVPPALEPLGQRIAIACDTAFSFTYPAILEGWHRTGAELVTFSPLADDAPDPDADAVYLPGGYPELFAGQLAANRTFLDGLRQASRRGAVIYGECGGYMMLGERLTDQTGMTHTMSGLLPISVSMESPRRHLGYRRMTLVEDGPLGRAGTVWRGHEFHYSTELDGRMDPLFRSSDAAGIDLGMTGAIKGNVAASFLHIIDCET